MKTNKTIRFNFSKSIASKSKCYIVIKMLNVMEYGITYSANEIMAKLGLKSKETFRKNYMNPALEQGIVKMTIPDKPNSKNQRYIKV